MTTVNISPTPVQRFVDSNGNALSGGQLFTYQAGTTTKVATYTDSTGATQNTNPIILNQRGEASIWLLPTQAYKFVLTTATDTDPPTSPIWTVDQIQAPGAIAVGNMTDEKGSGGTPGFVAGVDFTPGTTTSLTLSNNYVIAANIWVTFDGTEQGPDQYTLSGNTLIFNSPIPVGVQKVFVKGGTSLSIGTPGPNTVGAAQLVTGAVSAKLATEAVNQPSTGQFWSNLGARIMRFNDRMFLGTATQYDGKQTPSTTDWSGTTFPVTGGQGAYQYLVSGAAFAVGAQDGQLAGTFYARSSDASSGGGATIGCSAFVVNDNSTGTLGNGTDTWCFYGSTVRTSTATGINTNVCEFDVANLGTTVPIYPNQMFNFGQTGGVGICAGGELQGDSSVTLGTSSYALSIAQNDATLHANFDKGIVFASTAIAGSNGVTGSGIAIAFSRGHTMQWYNNSNQSTSSIISTAVNAGSFLNTNLNFSDFGALITDGMSNTLFRVTNGVANPVNYLMAQAAPTLSSPIISAQGSDANIDIVLTPKGTGCVSLGAYSSGSVSQAGYITVKDNTGTVRRLLVG